MSLLALFTFPFSRPRRVPGSGLRGRGCSVSLRLGKPSLGEVQRLGAVLKPQHFLGRGRVELPFVRVFGDDARRTRATARSASFIFTKSCAFFSPNSTAAVAAVVLGVVLLALLGQFHAPAGKSPAADAPGDRGGVKRVAVGLGGVERLRDAGLREGRPPVPSRPASAPPASPVRVPRRDIAATSSAGKFAGVHRGDVALRRLRASAGSVSPPCSSGSGGLTPAARRGRSGRHVHLRAARR